MHSLHVEGDGYEQFSCLLFVPHYIQSRWIHDLQRYLRQCMTDGYRTVLAISEGWGDTSVESIDVEWLVTVVSVERSEVSLIEDCRVASYGSTDRQRVSVTTVFGNTGTW
jgi:hypothetical protein